MKRIQQIHQLPWAKWRRTSAMMKASAVRTRFLAKRKTKHSSTLLLTVNPDSHRMGLRL